MKRMLKKIAPLLVDNLPIFDFRWRNLVVLPIQRTVIMLKISTEIRAFIRLELTMVQTTVSANFDFTFDVHTQSIRKLQKYISIEYFAILEKSSYLKCMEKCISDDRGSFISSSSFEETTDHFWSEHTTKLIWELNNVAPSIGSYAGFYSHVKLS